MCSNSTNRKIIQWIFMFSLIFYSTLADENKNNFDQLISEECPLTQYDKYVDCVAKILSTKTTEKEQVTHMEIEMETKCDQCDCETCNSEDFKSTESCCSSCCQFTPCDTRHCCYKTCHSGCQDLTCRFSCRQSCIKYIDSAKLVASQKRSEAFNSNNSLFNDDNLNITTRINLKNVVHNVNDISVPIEVNSTNVNDITIDDQQSSSNVGQLSNPPPCCDVSKPSKCTAVESFPFVECSFNKTRECGDSCRKNFLEKMYQKPQFFSNYGNRFEFYQTPIVDNYNIFEKNYNESIVNNNNTNANISVEVLWVDPMEIPQMYSNPISNYPVNYPGLYDTSLPSASYYYRSPPYFIPVSNQFTPNFLPQSLSYPIYFNTPMYPPLINRIQSSFPTFSNLYSQPVVARPFFGSNIQIGNPQLNSYVPNLLYQPQQMAFSPIYQHQPTNFYQPTKEKFGQFSNKESEAKDKTQTIKKEA